MTANIYFIYNNLADSSSSLSATSTSGSLAASNLLVDKRAAVWRSTGLSAQTLDMRWATAQSIDSICGAWGNFSSAATIQCKGYAEVGDVSTLFDQTVSADTALSLGNTTFQNWIPTAQNIKQLKIIYTDAANAAGYMQLSRLVVGKRISPNVNPSPDAFNITYVERSKPERTEGGDPRIEVKGRYRRLQLSLASLDVASRDLILPMLSKGLGQGVWISAFPDDSDASTRQLYGFWGALMSDTPIGYSSFSRSAAPLVIEEMGG